MYRKTASILHAHYEHTHQAYSHITYTVKTAHNVHQRDQWEITLDYNKQIQD